MGDELKTASYSSLITHHSSLLFGLDGLPLTEPRTGVGHYTFELARALARVAPEHDFELAYPSTYPPFDLGEGTSVEQAQPARRARPRESESGRPDEPLPSPPSNLRAARVPVNFLSRHWWSLGLPLYARRRGFDLFHGTNFDVPLWGGLPTVLTIHDLSSFLHPETHERRRVLRARRRVPLMARRATMIVTPTEAVRREVCGLLGVGESKVVAVHEAPRECFREPPAPEEAREELQRLGVSEGPFLLAVGTVEPRKNLVTLLDAFERVARAGEAPDLRLVVAGGRGWLTDKLFARVESSGVRARVHFTGYVGDEALRALYSSCALFIYPSLYEGFGLPPLEAAACGAPVLASRIAAHAEVLGVEAARLFPPSDADALARAISELIGDKEARRRLASDGRARAARFTWEQTARLTLGVYEEAFKREKRGQYSR